MKVKLTKLKESDNPKHPNNISDGHEVIGAGDLPERPF